MSMQIYLDSNVYLSVANREPGYEYTLAKIKSLFESGCIFPHAPPHAEELSARFISKRDVPATFRSYNLVKKYNGGMGYIPGYCNEIETLENIRLCLGYPELEDVLRIQVSNLKFVMSGKITEEQFATMLVKEDLGACMRRVNKYLNLTEVARQNEMFHFGRRDKKSLNLNFEDIGQPIDGVDTFLETQKKYKLGPHRLSRIPPSEIFEDKFFFEFIRLKFMEAGLNIFQIPTWSVLMKSHHQKEVIIGKILNCMEEAGYNQEERNHSASLVGRMHDVSHAIYASSSHYFVTNDRRFSKKIIAAYMRLGVPTKILSVDEFVRFDFSESQSKIDLPG